MTKPPKVTGPMKLDQNVESISILALSRDPAFQVRKKLDQPTIRRYVGVYTSGKEMPPVRVAKVKGVPVLVDGWHRVAALESMNIGEVTAVVSTMTRSEALWVAADANMGHGKPLTKAEVREVYQRYMKTNQHKKADGSLKSYRDIAADLGQGHTTIRNWEWKHFPATAKARGVVDTHPEHVPKDIVKDPVELREAEEAMAALTAAFTSSSDSEVRGNIVEMVEGLLSALKEAGNWDKPMF